LVVITCLPQPQFGSRCIALPFDGSTLLIARDFFNTALGSGALIPKVNINGSELKGAHLKRDFGAQVIRVG
jgi:hypothetical protein